MIKDVSSIEIDKDNKALSEYIETLEQAAEESDRQDAFSKVKLYSEIEFSISDGEGLQNLVASVIHLIENTDIAL